MLRGILLVATGHPYYGRMAYNLACSIKAAEPGMSISVITCKNGLNHIGEHQVDIFDNVITIESEFQGFGPKLMLDKLSPYDETLFFDADMLWLQFGKTPTELFDELNGQDFSAITEGWVPLDTLDTFYSDAKYYFWADLKEIKEQYKLESGIIYQWRSEVLYFKNTDLVKTFFSKAREIHNNPNLKTIRKFGTNIPDELAINISAAIHNFHPHIRKWTPAYWCPVHGYNVTIDRLRDFYLMSFGGHVAPPIFKRHYDNICKVSLKKLGRQHVFNLSSKKEFLPERFKI